MSSILLPYHLPKIIHRIFQRSCTIEKTVYVFLMLMTDSKNSVNYCVFQCQTQRVKVVSLTSSFKPKSSNLISFKPKHFGGRFPALNQRTFACKDTSPYRLPLWRRISETYNAVVPYCHHTSWWYARFHCITLFNWLPTNSFLRNNTVINRAPHTSFTE